MRIARPITFLVQSSAIGVGVLFFGGSALADSGPKPTESSTVAISSTTNSSVIINDHSATTVTKGESSSGVTVTASSPDNAVATQSQSTASPAISTSEQINQIATVVPAAAPPTLVESVTIAISSPVKPAEDTKSVPGQTTFVPSISLRSNLASTKYSTYSMTFFESMTAASQPFENSAPSTPVSPSNAPTQVPVPVQPLGMMSALLALFSEAVPGIFVHSFDLGANGFSELLIVLTMVALAVAMTARTTVVSYGTWLKQTGFTSVARSGLPAPFSSFAIPSMMGYVSAPAPYA